MTSCLCEAMLPVDLAVEVQHHDARTPSSGAIGVARWMHTDELSSGGFRVRWAEDFNAFICFTQLPWFIFLFRSSLLYFWKQFWLMYYVLFCTCSAFSCTLMAIQFYGGFPGFDKSLANDSLLSLVLHQACHGCVGSKCDCSGVKGTKVGKQIHDYESFHFVDNETTYKIEAAQSRLSLNTNGGLHLQTLQ